MPASRQARTPGTTRRNRPALHVALLGGFELTVDGTPCELGRGPSRIVAALTLNRGGISRAEAAEMLAPHLHPKSAASSLRKDLSRLRDRAPAALVEDDGRMLRLASHVTDDIPEVEALVLRVTGRGAPPLEDADAERLSLTLLPRWDDYWVGPVRVRLSDRCLNALAAHTRELESRGDRDAALVTVHWMLNADRLNEKAVGMQLEIYRAQWKQAKVARTYLTFRKRLKDELGIEPSPELRALVARLVVGWRA